MLFLKGGDDMEKQNMKLLFDDHFRPCFRGIDIIILRHLLKTTIECDSLSPQTISILKDIQNSLEAIVLSPGLEDCPTWFPIEKEDL